MNLRFFNTNPITSALLIFSALSLVLVIRNIIKFKKSRYKGKLAFIEVIKVSIYDDFIKGFESLSVKYKKELISKNLFYAKGFLANIGNIDISSSMIDSPITLTTSSGNNWEDIKISNSPTATTVNASKNEAIIEIALLKQDEAIEIDALIDSGNEARVTVTAINHRISDVHPGFEHIFYNRNNVTEVKSSYNRNLFFQSIVQVYIIIPLIVLYFFNDSKSLIIHDKIHKTEYKIPNKGKILENKLSVENIYNGSEYNVNVDDINNKNIFTQEVKSVHKKPNYFLYYYAQAVLIPLILSTLFNYWMKIRAAKRISLIVTNKKGTNFTK